MPTVAVTYCYMFARTYKPYGGAREFHSFDLRDFHDDVDYTRLHFMWTAAYLRF